MNKYQVIIFDIDGTVVDTEGTAVNSFIKTARELMRKEFSYEDALGYFCYPSSKVPSMIGYDNPEEFTHCWEQNFIALRHTSSLFPGIDRVIKRAHEQGFILGVVTSRTHFEYDGDYVFKPLARYFDYVVCAEDTENNKPAPDPIFALLEKVEQVRGIKVKPESCLYLGDTHHDCSCAKSAGCKFALADWKGRGVRDMQVDYVFRTAEEAEEICF